LGLKKVRREGKGSMKIVATALSRGKKEKTPPVCEGVEEPEIVTQDAPPPNGGGKTLGEYKYLPHHRDVCFPQVNKIKGGSVRTERITSSHEKRPVIDSGNSQNTHWGRTRHSREGT